MKFTPKVALLKKQIVLGTFRLFARLLTLVPRKRTGIVVELMLQSVAEVLADTKTSFLRYLITPFDANHTTLSALDFPNTAVVVSGRFETDYDFTLNTLRLMRQRYPSIILIYSGWGIKTEYSQELDSLSVYQVVSIEPQQPDYFNVMHQSTAVSAGLELARKLGAEFSIRLRADQRLINPNSIEYLHCVHSANPIDDKSYNLRGRIVGISDCLSLFAFGHFPDHFHFGYTSDLLKYWRVPEREPSEVPTDLYKMSSFINSKSYTEQILGNNFVSTIGLEIEESIEQHWKLVAECWVIIERQDIDLFWMKYRWWDFERGDQFDRHLNYPYIRHIHTTSNIHKEQWLMMQQKKYVPKHYTLSSLLEKNVTEILY